MNKTVITFTVTTFDSDGFGGDSDMHSKRFVFKGSFEEAKKFVEEIISKREETEKATLPL